MNVGIQAGKKYRKVNRFCYEDAKALAIVYDITRKSSFEEIKNYWIEDIKSCWSLEAIIVIVGNKLHFLEEKSWWKRW